MQCNQCRVRPWHRKRIKLTKLNWLVESWKISAPHPHKLMFYAFVVRRTSGTTLISLHKTLQSVLFVGFWSSMIFWKTEYFSRVCVNFSEENTIFTQYCTEKSIKNAIFKMELSDIFYQAWTVLLTCSK